MTVSVYAKSNASAHSSISMQSFEKEFPQIPLRILRLIGEYANFNNTHIDRLPQKISPQLPFLLNRALFFDYASFHQALRCGRLVCPVNASPPKIYELQTEMLYKNCEDDSSVRINYLYHLIMTQGVIWVNDRPKFRNICIYRPIGPTEITYG